MIKVTKHATAIAMAIFLLAQIGIVQHNVVHFTDHGHYEHTHDDHQDHDDHNKKNTSEACQICLLTESISLGLVEHHTGILTSAVADNDNPKSHDQVFVNHKHTRYNPRAPPSLLI